jgi:hypothetical protein
MQFLVASNPINDILNDFVTTFYEYLEASVTVSDTDLQITSGELDKVNVVFNYLGVFCIGIATIYFILELNKTLALDGRDLNIKSFMAPLLKYAIVLCFAFNSAKIVGWLLSLNNSVVTWGKSNLTASSHITKEDGGLFDSMSLITKCLMFLPLMLYWLVACIVRLVFKFKTITYRIELLVRAAFAPVAFTDLYNGMNSRTVSYIKGMIGMALYGLAFFLVPMLANAVYATDLSKVGNIHGITDLLFYFSEVLLIPIASIGCLSVARNVIKEALG